ncbi:MAG: hypothetical protein Q3966_03190 [Neisseria sp.]|nr:hypothetical protein [Neisseria sp.]
MILNFIKKLFGGTEGGTTASSKRSGWNAEEGVYYAKGSYDNAVEYNNELMCIANFMTYHMDDMNNAMDKRDYAQAEKVRLEWLASIPKYIAQADKLGAYKGDASLLNDLKRHLNMFGSLMEDGYKKLIAIRASGKHGTDEDGEQLDENNEKILDSTEQFNEMSDEFLEKFEDEDEDE